MWRHSPKRVLKIALPTIAALGAGAAIGVAAIPSADGTIHACVATSDGAVRIIDTEAGATCNAGSEKAIDWNQRGPAGPAGPAGPTGPQGDTGVGSSPSSSSSSSNDTFSTPTQAGGPSADMFLKLDGIAGASTDDKHKNEIDLTSFAFAVGRGGDGTGASAVAPAGATATSAKGRLQTLRVDKLYDAASPRLFRAAATGQHIKSAVLTFRRSNDDDIEFLTYTLGDVQVTSYDQGGKDGDARDLGSLEEEVGLTAAKVRVTEQTVSDGKKGPVVFADWTVPKAGAAKK
jgi:type VI secretion system secreted protein Hcp